MEEEQEMETFRSIKIIHNVEDRVDYLFLSEFFRFCGLYIGEGIASMPDSFERTDKNCFDVFVSIHEYEKNPEFEEHKEQYKEYLNLSEEVEGFIPLGDIFDKERSSASHQREEKDFYNDVETLEARKAILKGCLCDCLERLDVKFKPEELDRTVWRSLIDIYVDHNLMLYSSSLQYYQHRPTVAIQEATANMMAAYDSLEEILKGRIKDNGEERPADAEYAEYARIWCAVKSNLGFAFQRKTLFFPPQKLAEEAEKLYQNYPDFSNAIVLQGLCYENSKDKANEAIIAFNRALGMERVHCYATAIFYWLGKRYEAYDVRQNEAEYYYRSAYNKKKKFRNIYKLAIYAEQRGGYSEAKRYYLQIIRALEQKRKKCMEDPLELEYEFKTYRQLCAMYFRKCRDVTIKYRKTIEYADKAIAVSEQGVKNSNIYEYLYGEEKADEYRALSRSRMDLQYVYRILSLVYNELQEYDLARDYRDKLQLNG